MSFETMSLKNAVYGFLILFIRFPKDISLYNLSFTGPEKELQQLAVFGELHALFPDVHVHMELIGPSVPQIR